MKSALLAAAVVALATAAPGVARVPRDDPASAAVTWGSVWVDPYVPRVAPTRCERPLPPGVRTRKQDCPQP